MPLLTTLNTKRKERSSKTITDNLEVKISSSSNSSKTSFGTIGLSYKESRFIAEPTPIQIDSNIKTTFHYSAWIQAWHTKNPHLEFLYRKRSSEVKRWRYYYLDTKRKVTVGFSKDEVLDELAKIKDGSSTILSNGAELEVKLERSNPFIPVIGLRRKNR